MPACRTILLIREQILELPLKKLYLSFNQFQYSKAQSYSVKVLKLERLLLEGLKFNYGRVIV